MAPLLHCRNVLQRARNFIIIWHMRDDAGCEISPAIYMHHLQYWPPETRALKLILRVSTRPAVHIN